MAEADKDVLRAGFDRAVKLAFHAATVSSDAGLFPYRDLDEAAGPTASGAAGLIGDSAPVFTVSVEGSSNTRLDTEGGVILAPEQSGIVAGQRSNGKYRLRGLTHGTRNRSSRL